MSSVAEQLRQARKAKNLTVNQVADTTKIRTDHIRALEEGNYEMFSAPVYIRGFVRCYAKLLKLDLPPLMTALDVELRQTGKFRESQATSGAGHGPLDWLMFRLSKVNWRKAPLMLGTVVIVGALVFVYLSRRHAKSADPVGGLKPGVYQPSRTPGGDTLPLPPAAPRR
jgi:cytoskeleton protein RodZ